MGKQAGRSCHWRVYNKGKRVCLENNKVRRASRGSRVSEPFYPCGLNRVEGYLFASVATEIILDSGPEPASNIIQFLLSFFKVSVHAFSLHYELTMQLGLLGMALRLCAG
jgi:hypothetical protein